MKKLTVRKELMIMFSVLVCACGNDKDGDLGTNTGNGTFQTAINSYVRTMPSVKQIDPFSERKVGEPKPASFEYAFINTRAGSNKEFYEQAKEFEEQLLFSDDKNVFYPGALLRAKSVVEGEYDPIETERAPIVLSTDLPGSSDPTIKVEHPSLSTVRKAINDLLSRGFNAPGANLTYSIEEVYDKAHLKMAMGGNYKGVANSVEASAGFSFDKEKNRFLVKVQQVFYELSIDLPKNPSDFFAKEFEYKREFGAEKPLFVSSVKYGRILLLGIETNMTKKEAEAKLQASVLGGKIGAKAEAAYNDLLKESTIKGRVLGGDAKLGSLAAISLEDVKKFIGDGARLSTENPGVPIAYKLKELGTNRTFKTVIYSKYTKNDPYAGEFSKISFDLIVLDELKALSGRKLNAGRGFIQVGDNPKQRTEFFFDYWSKRTRHNIPNYKSGEKITVVFDRKNENDGFKKEYVFEIPLFETLVREGKRTGRVEVEKLYDTDKNPLNLRDTKEEVSLNFGIEKLKFYK